MRLTTIADFTTLAAGKIYAGLCLTPPPLPPKSAPFPPLPTAKKFGARHFVLSTHSRQMEKQKQSLDFILSTVNVNFNAETYLNILKSRGTLCIVGVFPGKIGLPAFPIIVEERSIVGSVIGSRPTIKTMLAFAARHGIEAKTECMRLSEVNKALDSVRKNKARYRMVLKV